MSLFGLFHTVFGLGVLVKEAAEECADDKVQRDIAKKENRSMYYVNGRIARSTKTGQNAYIDYGFGREDHALIRDYRTREVIEDLTVKKNIETQNELKAKAIAKGSVFYRTTKWDGRLAGCGVFVSDKIPGYFEQTSTNAFGHYENIYTPGELVEAHKSKQGFPMYKVETPFWKEGRKSYYSDGSIYSIDIMTQLDHRIEDMLHRVGNMSDEEYEKIVWNKEHYETSQYFKKGERFE